MNKIVPKSNANLKIMLACEILVFKLAGSLAEITSMPAPVQIASDGWCGKILPSVHVSLALEKKLLHFVSHGCFQNRCRGLVASYFTNWSQLLSMPYGCATSPLLPFNDFRQKMMKISRWTRMKNHKCKLFYMR